MLLSGEQVEIASGAQRAAIATTGATLRACTIGERAVIDGYGADEVCPSGRGQVLMPWPNRVANGRWELAGRTHQLPIDEPELGHAIHGLTRFAEWRVNRAGAGAARLVHRLPARPGYPFPLALSVEYRLSPSGLAVTFEATNLGATPCPFGAGAHPYFTFAGALADHVELSLPAAEWLELDARSIPLPRARRPVADTPLDFRRPRAIGAAHLDHAFTRLDRGSDGLARVLLRHRADELHLWLDRAFEFVQVFTADTLPDRTRRRHSIAVEPMTCAPNAFNSHDGLTMLAPGESLTARWGIEAR